MANLTVYKTQLQHKRKNVFFLQWKKVKEKSLNVEITLFLFDTFISSVPDYGCETKSFRIALKTEKVQIDFSKIYQ